jgi:hypothetical protein
MNYGYDSTDPLWKGRRTGVLAERLKEIAGLYNAPIQVTEEVLVWSSVTLRRLTNLSKNDLLNLIEVADKIFVEVMSPEATPEEIAADLADIAEEERLYAEAKAEAEAARIGFGGLCRNCELRPSYPGDDICQECCNGLESDCKWREYIDGLDDDVTLVKQAEERPNE